MTSLHIPNFTESKSIAILFNDASSKDERLIGEVHNVEINSEELVWFLFGLIFEFTEM
jgi:hypothetical protein